MPGRELRRVRDECVKFALSTFMSLFVFLVIAGAALAVQELVAYLEGRGADDFLLTSLNLTDNIILICDLIFLILYTARGLLEFIRATWHEFLG